MSEAVCETERELRRWTEALKARAAEWRLRRCNDMSSAAYLHVLVRLEHTVAIGLPHYFAPRRSPGGCHERRDIVADEATVQQWSSLLVTLGIEHALLGMLSFLELQSWLRLLQTLLRLVKTRVTLSHVIPRLWSAIVQRTRDHANSTTNNNYNNSSGGGGAVTLVAPIAVVAGSNTSSPRMSSSNNNNVPATSAPYRSGGSIDGTSARNNNTTNSAALSTAQRTTLNSAASNHTNNNNNASCMTNALCAALQLLRVLLMYIPGELEVQRRQLPHPAKTASLAVRVFAFQALPYLLLHQKAALGPQGSAAAAASSSSSGSSTMAAQPMLNADMLVYVRRGIECPAYAVHEAAVQAVREMLELGVGVDRNTCLALLRLLLDVCSAFGHASPQLQEDAGRAMGCLLAFLQTDMTCCSVTSLTQHVTAAAGASVYVPSYAYFGGGSSSINSSSNNTTSNANNNSNGKGDSYSAEEALLAERLMEWLFTPNMTRPTQNALATALATSLTLTVLPQNLAQALRALFLLLIPIPGDSRAYMPRLLVDALSRYAAQLPCNALRVGLLAQLRLYVQDVKEDRQVLRTALAAMTAVAAMTSSAQEVAMSIAHTAERLLAVHSVLHSAVSELLAALAEHCPLLQEYVLQRMMDDSRSVSSHNNNNGSSSNTSTSRAAASFVLYAKAFLALSGEVQATARFAYPLLTTLLQVQLAAPPAMSMSEVDYMCTEYVFRLTQLLLQRHAARLSLALRQRLELASGHYLRLLVSFPAPLMAYFRAASAACALLLTRDKGVAEAERVLLIGMLEGQLVGSTGLRAMPQARQATTSNTSLSSSPSYATAAMLDRLKGEVYKVSTVTAWGHRRDEGSVRWLITQALKDLTEVCAQAIPIALDDAELFPAAVASFMHDIHALRPSAAQRTKAETAQRAAQLVAWGVHSLCRTTSGGTGGGVGFCRNVLQRVQELYARYSTLNAAAAAAATSASTAMGTRTTNTTQSPYSPALSTAASTAAAAASNNTVGGGVDVALVEPSLRLAAVQWNVLVILYYILQVELQGRMKHGSSSAEKMKDGGVVVSSNDDAHVQTRTMTWTAALGEAMAVWRGWALQWAATQPLFVVKLMAAKVHGCISVLLDEVDNHTSQLVQRAGSIEEDVSGLLLSLVEVQARQQSCWRVPARTFPMLLSCLAAGVRKHGLGGNPCSLQTMALMLAAVRLVELDVLAEKGVLASVMAHAMLQLGELSVDPIVLLLLFAFFSLLRTQRQSAAVPGVAQQLAPFLSPSSVPVRPVQAAPPREEAEVSIHEVQCDMTSAMLLHVLWSLQGGVVRPNVETAKLSLARRSLALAQANVSSEASVLAHTPAEDIMHDVTTSHAVAISAAAAAVHKTGEQALARVMARYLRDATHRYALILSRRNARTSSMPDERLAHATTNNTGSNSGSGGARVCVGGAGGALREALPFAGETLAAPVAEGLGKLWMTCLAAMTTHKKEMQYADTNMEHITTITYRGDEENEQKTAWCDGCVSNVPAFLSEVALVLGVMTSKAARSVWEQLAHDVLMLSCTSAELRPALRAMRYIVHVRHVALRYGPAIVTDENARPAQPGRGGAFHTRSLSGAEEEQGVEDDDERSRSTRRGGAEAAAPSRGLYLAARMAEDAAELGETILGHTSTNSGVPMAGGLVGAAAGKAGRRGRHNDPSTGITSKQTTAMTSDDADNNNHNAGKAEGCDAAGEMYGDAESLRVSADAAVKAAMLRLLRVVLDQLACRNKVSDDVQDSAVCIYAMSEADRELVEAVLSAMPLAENTQELLRPALALLQAVLQCYGSRCEQERTQGNVRKLGSTQNALRPCLLPWKSQLTAALRALVQSSTFAIAAVCALVRTWLASNLVDDGGVKRVMRGVAVLLVMQDRLAMEGRVPPRRDASALLYLLVYVHKLSSAQQPLPMCNWPQTQELVTHTLCTSVAQELLSALCEAWTARLSAHHGHLPPLSFLVHDIDQRGAAGHKTHSSHAGGQESNEKGEDDNDDDDYVFDGMSLTTLSALRLGPLEALVQMLARLFTRVLQSPALSLRHAAGILACTTLLSTRDNSTATMAALSTLLPRLSCTHQELLGVIALHMLQHCVAACHGESMLDEERVTYLTQLMRLLSLSLRASADRTSRNEELVALVHRLAALQPGHTLYTCALLTLALQCNAPCGAVITRLLAGLPVDALVCVAASDPLLDEAATHYLRSQTDHTTAREVMQCMALSGTAGLALIEHACRPAPREEASTEQQQHSSSTALVSPLLLPTVPLAALCVLHEALCETRNVLALLQYMWPQAAAEGGQARHYMQLLALLAATTTTTTITTSESEVCTLLDRCERHVTRFMTYVLLPMADSSTTITTVTPPFVERLTFCVHYILSCAALPHASPALVRLKQALSPVASILTQQVLRLQAAAMREVVRALPAQDALRLRRFLETGSADAA